MPGTGDNLPGVLSSSDLQFLRQRHPGALFLASEVRDHCSDLAGEEWHIISSAVDSRRREFSTGRWLAREGLSRLGEERVAIPQGARREPVWPDSIIGSISHTSTQVVVVLALQKEYRGIGIDLEEKNRVEAGLLCKLVTERERLYHGDIDYTLLFSAKEAIYKLMFPVAREYIDFLDVEVELCFRTSSFSASYIGENKDANVLAGIEGSFIDSGSLWLSFASMTWPGRP